MLCAIITFSACSSDDDPVKNPLTGVVIPATAQIGSEMTIQGQGFADGQSIQLQLVDRTPVVVSAKFSANGATFEVPYTLTEGTASVVLTDGKNSWPIGTVALTAPAVPVTAVAVPDEMALAAGKVSVSGIGFREGDVLEFADADNASKSRMDMIERPNFVAVNVTADGASFDMPSIAEGEYEVVLHRGANMWDLGSAYVYQPKRIKSVYFENGLLAMIGATSVTMKFSYNEDGTLKTIDSQEGLSYSFSYSGNTVSATSPLLDKPLEFTMENGKVVKSLAAYAEDEYPTTKYDYWTYNDDNTLASVLNKDNWYRGLQLTSAEYSDKSLSSLSFGGDVTFSPAKVHAVPGTIDVRYLLDMFSYIYQGEDIFVGMLLNSSVKTSSYFPAMEHIAYMVPTATGDYENKVADVNLNTSFSDNVLTIDFLSFKDLENITGTYGSKIVVTYENK